MLNSIAATQVRGIIIQLEQKVKWHYEGNGMFGLCQEALENYEHDLPILRSIVEDRASNTEGNNTAVALLKEIVDRYDNDWHVLKDKPWFYDRANAVIAQSPLLPNTQF
jgi:hypothetical protein